ncbi:MAG: hypothetical protein IPP51_03430 [Bacteroidetes bacterium]|nr:hypothetical protein [Bacteroidota bacterium]
MFGKQHFYWLFSSIRIKLLLVSIHRFEFSYGEQPTATPTATTSYIVTASHAISGISTNDTVTVTVTPNSATITPGSLTSLCQNGTVSIPYTVTCSFGAGNVFTAQLSDASGNFTTPITIGTLTGFARPEAELLMLQFPIAHRLAADTEFALLLPHLQQ